LSAAGIASLQFTPDTTAADFASLVRGFIFSGSKAKSLGEQLQAALQDCKTIEINRVKFVPEGSAGAANSSISASLASAAFGDHVGQLHAVLNDPASCYRPLPPRTLAQVRV